MWGGGRWSAYGVVAPSGAMTWGARCYAGGRPGRDEAVVVLVRRWPARVAASHRDHLGHRWGILGDRESGSEGVLVQRQALGNPSRTALQILARGSGGISCR